MPRMNLTQAEAELIKSRREAERIQVETYNRALDDVLEALGDFDHINEMTIVLNQLRKEVPK